MADDLTITFEEEENLSVSFAENSRSFSPSFGEVTEIASGGTVTSVSVKMNGAVKGTVTTSGTIDLGTVLTEHQDISGKADTSTVTAIGNRVTTIEGKESTWDGKQDAISDLATIRSNASTGAGLASDVAANTSARHTHSNKAILDATTVAFTGHQSLSAYRTSSAQDTIDGGKADLIDGKVPSSQLPSYVDDVLEYASLSDFPSAGETGKIYIAQDTNKTYRWSGTAYTEISASLALGETSATAYRGDRGATAYTHSQTTSGNPHNVLKSDVGLGNCDNTSDATKKTNFTGSIASGNTGFVKVGG